MTLHKYTPLNTGFRIPLKKSHLKFLKQVLINDNNRTPVSTNDWVGINLVIQQGWYRENNKEFLNNIRKKYKDHVWGTHV